jgi:hypothetical protein
MNPGAQNTVARFDRRARGHMSSSEWSDWQALDSINVSGNSLTYGRAAQRARLRVPHIPPDDIRYTRHQRVQRRATFKRARQDQRRLLGRVRRAMRSGNPNNIAATVENVMRSYNAKLCAYADAWATMKMIDRPHIAALPDYAAQLDPYKLKFEEASVHFQLKQGRAADTRTPEDYRQIVNFGIHHRARQQLVLSILKVCFAELRNDQFQQQGKGRNAAIDAAIVQMRSSPNEFVSELDIEDFFPSIGEKGGRLSPINELHQQLYMLPRAIVESSVLSSGVIFASRTGGATLSRTTPIRNGVPQGSALSSYLSDHIVGEIMSDAETQASDGQVMIAYCDNIAVFGQSRMDVNSMTEPLVSAAERSPYGDFRLRRTQSTRHIRQGFLFLGYYLKWHPEGFTGFVEVDVADHNKERFQTKIAELMPQCRFSRSVTRAERTAALHEIQQCIVSWVQTFNRSDNIGGLVSELLNEVLSEETIATRLAFRPILDQLG